MKQGKAAKEKRALARALIRLFCVILLCVLAIVLLVEMYDGTEGVRWALAVTIMLIIAAVVLVAAEIIIRGRLIKRICAAGAKENERDDR